MVGTECTRVLLSSSHYPIPNTVRQHIASYYSYRRLYVDTWFASISSARNCQSLYTEVTGGVSDGLIKAPELTA